MLLINQVGRAPKLRSPRHQQTVFILHSSAVRAGMCESQRHSHILPFTLNKFPPRRPRHARPPC
jgi:hypothetical protein